MEEIIQIINKLFCIEINNKNIIMTYYNIGKIITDKNLKYNIIENLIKNKYGVSISFSKRNLKAMYNFYILYYNKIDKINFNISWNTYYYLINIKENEKREKYLNICINNNFTSRMLKRYIKNNKIPLYIKEDQYMITELKSMQEKKLPINVKNDIMNKEVIIMATPHIEASKEDIAKVVIMPGDPLRAKLIAEKYLENYKLVNSIRNMYGYTGFYKGKKVSIMSSGMGAPSMGIYSYELFKEYDVDKIIRIGSAGSYTKDLNLKDLILVNSCYSESSYAKTQNGCEDNIIYASNTVNLIIKQTAEQLNIPLTICDIHSSDVFYKEEENFKEIIEKYGCLAVEMESFALFHNANILNKKAACILTVSDNFITQEKASSEERQNSFKSMIELSLESIL